jgi:hypothetical protein
MTAACTVGPCWTMSARTGRPEPDQNGCRMNEDEERVRSEIDAAALNELAELFRLSEWRVDNSRVLFIEAAADIIRQVRDLSDPPSAGFLLEHRWVYDAENDIYDDLDERRMWSTTCDFCDRVFCRDLGGRFQGISGKRRDDPDEPGWWISQEICDLCKADQPPGMWPEHLQPE